MTNAIDLELINATATATTPGTTLLWPMIMMSNIAQGSAVIGTILLNKKDEKLKEVAVPAAISCYLGVTEPAMFGVNLKYRFPFLAGMIGSAIAGLFMVSTKTGALSIGVGGIPGFLVFPFDKWGIVIIGMLISIVVPMALTVILGKRNKINA